MVDAIQRCDVKCDQGLDSECPGGEKCFIDIPEQDCIDEVPSFPPSSEGYCDKNLIGIPQQGSLGGNLISTLSGNDITSGFMFDVVAISDIIVTGIDLHIVSGESYSEIRLYATCCNLISYDQVKRHPRAWKLSGSIKVQGSGYGQLTSL